MRQILCESTEHRLFSFIHPWFSQGIKNRSKRAGHVQCYLFLKLGSFVGLKNLRAQDYFVFTDPFILQSSWWGHFMAASGVFDVYFRAQHQIIQKVSARHPSPPSNPVLPGHSLRSQGQCLHFPQVCHWRVLNCGQI